MEIFTTVIRDSRLDHDEYKILSGYYYTNYGLAEAEAEKYNSTAYPEYPAEVMILTSRVDEAIEYARAILMNGGEMYVDDNFMYDSLDDAVEATDPPYNIVAMRNIGSWEIVNQEFPTRVVDN